MTGRAEAVLSELSLEEKVRLLAGRDWWHTEPIERLGVGAIHLSDGPVGVRGPRWIGATSISFPCGAAIGATFDPGAAALLAAALGDECREKGVDVLLGPTVNLQRHPLGGRHFECYSEDPVLTAELAIAYIESLQARGVAATIKHFVANDTEFERHTISSEVDEETLRRAYLLPFEEAVTEARPLALMTSYNKVNGTYAAENRALVAEVLRGEWGFDGLVMSDWFGAHSTVASALAGLDLEMPGPPLNYGQKLLEAVSAGELSEEVVTDRARAVLQLAERLGRLEAEGSRRPEPVTTRAERREIARQLARRSFVLLSNTPQDGSAPLLPLSLEKGQLLAVIGPNAARPALQGGGSAAVQPELSISILQGLEEAYRPEGVEVRHAVGCRNQKRPAELEGPFVLEYHAGGLSGEMVFAEETPAQPFNWAGPPVDGVPALEQGAFGVRCRAELLARATGHHRLHLSQVGRARLLVEGEVLLQGSREPGEGFDGLASKEVSAEIELEEGRRYEVVVEYESIDGLPVAGFFVGHEPPLVSDDELIREAAGLARQADAVLCVVGTSSEWETEGEDRAGLQLPGRQDELVEAVLAANDRTVVVLNTGSPPALPWAGGAAAILQVWFGGEMIGRAVADVVTGAEEPGGRLPHTMPKRLEDTPAFAYYPGEGGEAPYGERLNIGYRHYAGTGTEPLFWFGHGLSYASFGLETKEVTETPEEVICRAVVTNRSARNGAAVLQAYGAPDGPREGEPPVVFLGARRCEVTGGESVETTVTVPRRRLARLGLRGSYRLLVGWSADPDGLLDAGGFTLEA